MDSGIVDLRSDTVTRPTPAMLEAMMRAPLGDDVLGDDPTVNLLCERVADLFGKESAIFVPSGTMANQVALRALTEPGDEIICHPLSHIYLYEGGAPAALSGCSIAFADGARGMFTPEAMLEAIRPIDDHDPVTKVVCIENTQNRGGGSVWPIERVGAVSRAARERGLKMHLDGARIMNAVVASGVSAREYGAHFDTVTICFSKGLGAPVGSAVAGDAATIRRAKRFRKMFGGAMRQSGVLAAGAIYALDHHVERLAEDHSHARRLAEGLAGLPGVRVDPDAVQTNIVYFDVAGDAAAFCGRLAGEGVLMLALGRRTVRAVTHLNVNLGNIERAIRAIHRGIGSGISAESD